MEPQEKILKTSLELFFKYGIKRVTMDDIAKELGMSKKTIYHFYNEKDVDMSKLLPQYLLDSDKQKEILNKYETETKEYVGKLKKNTGDKIQLIQDNITVLEGKLTNTNSKLGIELQGRKLEYQAKIEQMKKKLDDDMAAYKKQKEDEYNATKKKIETEKSAKWENDLAAVKQSTAQKCQKL